MSDLQSHFLHRPVLLSSFIDLDARELILLVTCPYLLSQKDRRQGARLWL